MAAKKIQSKWRSCSQRKWYISEQKARKGIMIIITFMRKMCALMKTRRLIRRRKEEVWLCVWWFGVMNAMWWYDDAMNDYRYHEISLAATIVAEQWMDDTPATVRCRVASDIVVKANCCAHSITDTWWISTWHILHAQLARESRDWKNTWLRRWWCWCDLRGTIPHARSNRIILHEATWSWRSEESSISGYIHCSR